MNGTQTVEVDEIERLRTQLVLARKRLAELEDCLRATKRDFHELRNRLTLSDQERAVLAGRSDGCIRITEVQPLLRRVFGRSA